MKITQLDKNIETIKNLDISEYCNVYFLILKKKVKQRKEQTIMYLIPND